MSKSKILAMFIIAIVALSSCTKSVQNPTMATQATAQNVANLVVTVDTVCIESYDDLVAKLGGWLFLCDSLKLTDGRILKVGDGTLQEIKLYFFAHANPYPGSLFTSNVEYKVFGGTWGTGGISTGCTGKIPYGYKNYDGYTNVQKGNIVYKISTQIKLIDKNHQLRGKVAIFYLPS